LECDEAVAGKDRLYWAAIPFFLPLLAVASRLYAVVPVAHLLF
jgi:hypothetical protein